MPNQGGHAAWSIQSDHGDVAFLRGHTGGFDVQVKRSGAEGAEQSPMVPGVKASREVGGVALLERGLRGDELAVVERFAARGHPREVWLPEKRAPLAHALLPEAAFG